MGIFYNDQEKARTSQTNNFWKNMPVQVKPHNISGRLHQNFVEGPHRDQVFYANERELFFYEDGRMGVQELDFCVLQEHFYLHNRKKIYQLNLISKEGNAKLWTYNQQTYISFYTHLAKFCILKSLPRHYKLKQKIGEGAFSKVYNGQNILCHEEVALKIFSKQELQKNENLEEIVKNQIKTLRYLKQYKLSPIIGVYETPDSIVIVLQKAEAGNMIDYLKEHQTNYSEEFVRQILYKIVENLYQLHRAGYIHRDLKPQNILFKNQEIGSAVFFGDFGVTVQKYEANRTKIGRSAAGTIGFMAPQIIKHQVYDQKCDMFSFGCLIYYLYTGKPLFKRNDMSYVIRDSRALEERIRQLYTINPLIYDLCIKLIKIDPEERIDASEVLEHEYFKGFTCYEPEVGEEDRTLREFINKRIQKFFA